jgi:dTDP-glucose 4,6-dehydratase
VDAFLLAAGSRKAVGQTINSGFGQEISIGDLAQLIGRLMGKKIHVISEKERERPSDSEVERLLADNNLAKDLLGWQPKITLEEGLKITIEWIEQNLDNYKAEGYAI